MTDISVPGAMTGSASSDDISVELSSRRAGMSFQRTRMSADRTLMSVIRTALSLISLGFTIHRFFGHPQDQRLIHAKGRRPASFTLMIAILPLCVGSAAIVSLGFGVGSFR